MDQLVGFLRHDIFFEQNLDSSGNRLEKAFRAAAVRAEADLEAADQAPFPPDEDDNYGQHCADDEQYRYQRRRQVDRPIGPAGALQK